jgi:hypothetical protein
MRCVLIQANGNNIRLSKYFKQPKYELYYRGERIINQIIKKSIESGVNKVFVAVRKDTSLNFDISNVEIIYCEQTNNRLDTLKQCFNHLNEYKSTIIHDCDTIIDSEVLSRLNEDSLVISNYKLDGLKYGFIELDHNLEYLKGNEKKQETGHISIGAYSVNNQHFNKYLKIATEESLLSYYNQCNNVKVIYSKNHINLGDIESYINNLWSL